MALWREALLAKAVLRRRTRGYRRHPQLDRFRTHPQPVAAITTYLGVILDESRRRGFRFDGRKARGPRTGRRIGATRGQVAYEWKHLLAKLKRRSPADHRAMRRALPLLHPLFRLTRGPVASWERVSSRAARGA